MHSIFVAIQKKQSGRFSGVIFQLSFLSLRRKPSPQSRRWQLASTDPTNTWWRWARAAFIPAFLPALSFDTLPISNLLKKEISIKLNSSPAEFSPSRREDHSDGERWFSFSPLHSAPFSLTFFPTSLRLSTWRALALSPSSCLTLSSYSTTSCVRHWCERTESSLFDLENKLSCVVISECQSDLGCNGWSFILKRPVYTKLSTQNLNL